VSDLAGAFGHPPPRIAAVLYAYVDETGLSGRDRAALVGGAIATEEAWRGLEPRWWNRVHQDGISEFHATKCRGGHGEYHAWRPDWNRMSRHYTALADIAADYGLRPTSGTLLLDDWERWEAPELKARLRSPYAFCFELCLFHIHQTALRSNERAVVVYSINQEHQEAAEALAVAYARNMDKVPRIVSCAPGKPKEIAGLQVADMMAYEMYHWWHSQNKPNRPPLELLPRTKRPLDNSTGVYYDLEGLRTLAAEGAPEIT
jgi:hypothetical protein